METETVSWLESLRARQRARGHRALLWFEGPIDARALLGELEAAGFDQARGFGGAWGSARELWRWLGDELDALVLDLRERADLDAIGQAHGLIRAGGVLALVTGEASDLDAPSVARLRSRLAGSEEALRLQGPLPAEEAGDPWPGPETSPDQSAALAAMRGLLGEEPGPPRALVANRGRGKSTTLGWLAAEALARDLEVRVVAPHARGRSVLMESAFARAVELGVGHRVARWLRPLAPEALEREADHQGVLWLVDEAAALPSAALDPLFGARRVALATTVQGYEGSGRGFTERFLGRLERRRPGARRIDLHAPIRWAPGDPLERTVFTLLCLDAAPEPSASLEGGETVGAVRWTSGAALATDEGRLRSAFGLLSGAHYRTTPGDLGRMLDEPGEAVLTWEASGEPPVGAAWVAREGGLDDATALEVERGHVRPRGHAIPESLLRHSRLPEAGAPRGLRVVRVAVHPERRRVGVGGAMLEAIAEMAKGEARDWVGSLFGVSDDLLAFWASAGFTLVRLSVSRGASTGAHAALVMKATSSTGEALVETLRARLVDDLSGQLAEGLRSLEPAIALRAFRAAPRAAAPPPLDEDELDALVAHAFLSLPYDLAAGPTRRVVTHALADPDAPVDAGTATLLVEKVLQHRAWTEVTAGHGFDGPANAMRALRAAMRPLVRWVGGEAVTSRLARLGRS